MASTSTRTETNRDRGVHSVNGSIAAVLVGMGFARRVAQWDAVEITDAGRAALTST